MRNIPLENEEQLKEIKSCKGYSVIFKHNTDCPISRGVHKNLEKEAEKMEGVECFYYLDLHRFWELSNAISGQYGIPHQSPQILLIKDGTCTYHEWGYNISADATMENVERDQ